MSAAIRLGYAYSPTLAFSRCFPAFSLNWVMRLSQPNRAMQLKIQASSACAETWLWLKMMQRFASTPAAR
jgi:hypothetical protein